MAELAQGPFAGVATPAGICIQTSQDTIIAELAKVTALIPDPDTAPANRGDNAYGIFDKIDPILATQLRTELAALSTAIDAMAVA